MMMIAAAAAAAALLVAAPATLAFTTTTTTTTTIGGARRLVAPVKAVSIETMIEKAKSDRLAHLEAQALESLKIAGENFESAVFPNAMIVGDCVITHLLGKLGYLSSGEVKVMVVDTMHLFDSTMPFLEALEKKYEFKAEVFTPVGCETVEDFNKVYGKELWVANVEEYDRAAKVEPFQRGLKTLEADVMINGRRRDHGAERAYIDIAEVAPIGGGLAKLNPLAYWTLEDCFDYAKQEGIPLHPTVALGYPSQGDAKDTVPVPDPEGLSGVQGEAGSVKWVNGEWFGDKAVWLDYGCERRGRFVGLAGTGGKKKTECGIHVAGAERTWDRDLWSDEDTAVAALGSQDEAIALKNGDDPAVVVVYAPWCPFCQAMEAEYELLAKDLKDKGITVAKYRGDEDREFVSSEFNVEAFPTIDVVVPGKGLVKYDSEDREKDKLLAFFDDQVAAIA
ncbi:hypothetical protein CTAYLR_004721 [Chrysophaeum taylorii]|uniref:Thioredoxin domain-containing protein n=1 Tax=Chrysophaeum taylorii TaxID=2483200 RepID=A0AAD7U9K6_9STRA|nr:hypothetical protein CTAYLR_004721 [Chrysophaeum taylorii]